MVDKAAILHFISKSMVTPLYHNLPGDEYIIAPRQTVTHSIMICAMPAQIWPWLVQMGADRAGWYSFDRIDNGGKSSAQQIVPRLQQIHVGDLMPVLPEAKDGFIVRALESERALILVLPVQSVLEEANNFQRMKGPLRVSWAFILEAIDPMRTRLISRGRISKDWLVQTVQNRGLKQPIFIERVYQLFGKMTWYMMMPFALAGHYIMESRMLHGIKRRAETCTLNSKEKIAIQTLSASDKNKINYR